MVAIEKTAPRIVPMVTDASHVPTKKNHKGKQLLFEGAQDALLDIDYGAYPFVTSSNCLAGAAPTGTGVAPQILDYVLGTIKAHTTRVGSGPFPAELFSEMGTGLTERGNEFDSVTGRARCCGWFGAVVLERSTQVNGIPGMCVAELDVIGGIENINVCIGYELPDGNRTDILPLGVDAMAGCKPTYETMSGWKESTFGVESHDASPDNIKACPKCIKGTCGAPVAIISTGPDRRETIILHRPFARYRYRWS